MHDGKLLYEMDKLDEAEAKLKLALKEDPHNEAALYYLNLVSQAKFALAAKTHEVTMRQDIRAVEQAWANPVKRELLPVPNPYARRISSIPAWAARPSSANSIASGSTA